MIKNKLMFYIKNNQIVDYLTPINLNYLWTFGFSAAICLVVQILTGIFLAMHYTPHIDLAFLSIENIMNEVDYNGFIKFFSLNIAPAIFIMCYIYIVQSIFIGAYKNGYFLGCSVFITQIKSGTKWHLLTNTISKHKKNLIGIDEFDDSCWGAEWLSHFFEMERVQDLSLELNKDLVYFPIQNLWGKARLSYSNSLYDGLVYDYSKGSIVEKIEFKSKQNRSFSEHQLNLFKEKYEPRGVDRVDLCHIKDYNSFEQTELTVKKINADGSSLQFNPVDFTWVYYEKADPDFIENIDKVINNQIELKDILNNIAEQCAHDPNFLTYNPSDAINIGVLDKILF